MKSQEMNGGQALIKALEMEGVETIFGLPGGCILPVYDPIIDSPIRHILVRHEQGAGHMAEGYAHVTGRPGVAMVTSGPAATNIVTPLCDAYMDSIPMVVITGQVSTAFIGTDAFQECDTVGITRSVTKHNELVTSAADIPRAVREAFHIAQSGRPGPVLLDIPKDIVDPKNPNSAMDWYWPTDSELEDGLPGYKVNMHGDPEAIKAAARLIMEAKQPVLYVGRRHPEGPRRRSAEGARRTHGHSCRHHADGPRGVPRRPSVVPRHAGHARQLHRRHRDAKERPAHRARLTLRRPGHRPPQRIRPGRQDHPRRHRPGRDGQGPPPRRADRRRLPLHHRRTDHRDQRPRGQKAQPDRSAWKSTISGWQEKFPLQYDEPVDGDLLKPQMVLEHLRDSAPDDCIVASGVGQHQMWTSQYWKFNHPYTWVNSGGLGTMGFAVPAAIGAKVGRPDKMVWAVDGDGCFQMTAQELVTASAERIPVKIAILNNAYLGMVRQWQEMFYEERYSEVYLSADLPDYKMWAEAMGCVGIRVDSPEEIQPAIDKANSIDDRPVVIDFRTDSREKVFPMVAAGASNDDIITGDPKGGVVQ